MLVVTIRTDHSHAHVTMVTLLELTTVSSVSTMTSVLLITLITAAPMPIVPTSQALMNVNAMWATLVTESLVLMLMSALTAHVLSMARAKTPLVHSHVAVTVVSLVTASTAPMMTNALTRPTTATLMPLVLTITAHSSVIVILATLAMVSHATTLMSVPRRPTHVTIMPHALTTRARTLALVTLASPVQAKSAPMSTSVLLRAHATSMPLVKIQLAASSVLARLAGRTMVLRDHPLHQAIAIISMSVSLRTSATKMPRAQTLKVATSVIAFPDTAVMVAHAKTSMSALRKITSVI